MTVTDINEDRCMEFAALPGVEVVRGDEIYDVDADVFIPQALGGILNGDTIPRLKVKVVAGAANNQLLGEEHAAELYDRGILCWPGFHHQCRWDYQCFGRGPTGRLRRAHRCRQDENIHDGLREVFETSRRENLTPAAWYRVAENRLEEARQMNGQFNVDSTS